MSSRSYPSTTSLLSTHAKSATPATPKNYEAAFGSLASSYGSSTHVAPSLPHKSAHHSKKPATPPKTPHHSKQPTTAAPTPGTNQPLSRAAKDYETAFGALSSTCGLGTGYNNSQYGGKP